MRWNTALTVYVSLNVQLGRTIVSPTGALILIPGPCPWTSGRRSTAASTSLASAQSFGASLRSLGPASDEDGAGLCSEPATPVNDSATTIHRVFMRRLLVTAVF